MTERQNYISIFKERRTPEGSVQEPIGDFPVATGTYKLPNGRDITLNLSQLTQSMRGPRIIEVRLDSALRSKAVSLDRRTGLGYQGLGKNLRLGVKVNEPKGVTTR